MEVAVSEAHLSFSAVHVDVGETEEVKFEVAHQPWHCSSGSELAGSADFGLLFTAGSMCEGPDSIMISRFLNGKRYLASR